MSVYIIIQARMTSTRLPAKVMLPLCGKPVLEIMLERLQLFQKNIIIATTNDGSQQPIVELCQRLNIKYYEGDTDDVLSRYYEAARQYHVQDSDLIVRCTSDCPLIDAEIIQLVLDYYKRSDFDYVVANACSGFPRGLDIEVFNFALLKKVHKNATQAHEREHVTPYIYHSNTEAFKIGSFNSTIDASKYRLTLDETEDYQAIKEVYKLLGCQTDYNYQQLITILESNPYLYDINKAVEQKKL